MTRLEPGEKMHAGNQIGSVEHPRLDDLAGASGRKLLRVLEDEAHLARKLVAVLEQQLGRSEQHRRVAVVPTGVHHAGRIDTCGITFSSRIGRASMSPRSTTTLPGRGAVKARHNRRSRRPLDLEAAERAQGLLDERGGLVLLERQLGVGVQVPAPRDRARFEVVRDET